MKIRYVHDHERDPAEVERLVAFAAAPLRRQAPVTVAVKVNEPSPWHTPSGTAYNGDVPRWAGRAPYALTLRLPSEHLPSTRYGQAHVCYHAADYQASWDDPGDDTRSESWRAHSADWHRRVQEAYDRGERRWGRWPIYVMHDWREALIHIAAHEALHVAQFVNGRSHSEIECELYAERQLAAWRAAQ